MYFNFLQQSLICKIYICLFVFYFFLYFVECSFLTNSEINFINCVWRVEPIHSRLKFLVTEIYKIVYLFYNMYMSYLDIVRIYI